MTAHRQGIGGDVDPFHVHGGACGRHDGQAAQHVRIRAARRQGHGVTRFRLEFVRRDAAVFGILDDNGPGGVKKGQKTSASEILRGHHL